MRKSTRKIGTKAGSPKYRSDFEKRGAEYLQVKGVAFEYEKHSLKYTVPEKHKTYTPDFVLSNGVIIEFKGKLDKLTQEKMGLIFQQYPEHDIRMVFMRDNKMTKKSKTRYSDWAKKKGIKFHVSEEGVVPDEWLV